MVYITGDIHGEVYRVSEMIEKYEITPNDIIVILGDVGMNYYGNKHGDRRNKKRLNNFDIPILCIHGNHEMRPETLITYREEPWMGGTVYFEEEFPNLFFAKDGEIYDLEGIKAIAIGGAYSVDKWYRLQRNIHWFPDEQPSVEIKTRVEKKLDDLGWQIDINFHIVVFCVTFKTPDFGCKLFTGKDLTAIGDEILQNAILLFAEPYTLAVSCAG